MTEVFASWSNLSASGEGITCLGAQTSNGGQFRSMGARELGFGEEKTFNLSGVLGLGI